MSNLSSYDLIDMARNMGLYVVTEKWNDQKDRLSYVRVKAYNIVRKPYKDDQELITHWTYHNDMTQVEFQDVIGKAWNDLKQFERWK